MAIRDRRKIDLLRLPLGIATKFPRQQHSHFGCGLHRPFRAGKAHLSPFEPSRAEAADDLRALTIQVWMNGLH